MENILQSYFVALGTALGDAGDVETVKQILDHALKVLNLGQVSPTPVLQHQGMLQPLSESLTKSIHLMDREDRFTVVSRPPRGTWVDCLLSVVAADWWHELTQEDRETLFEPFILEAPIMAALAALEGYLSISLSDTLPGGHIALSLLEKILGQISQGGLDKFAEDLLKGRGSRKGESLEGLIFMLATLPDVVPNAHDGKRNVQHEVAFCIAESLLGSCATKVNELGTEQYCLVSAGVQDLITFLVQLLEKLVRRGYVVPVAKSFVKHGNGNCLKQHDCVVRRTFISLGVREKVFSAMLNIMCIPIIWEDSKALAVLACLVGPNCTSNALSEQHSPKPSKLLLSRSLLRAPCPYPALCWILHTIALYGKQLLEKCAIDLCRTWSDSNSIVSLGLPHQAFLTAALVLVIEGLLEAGEDPVHNHKLSELILEGISNRLDNPSAVINYQGMRVADVLGKGHSGKEMFKDVSIDFIRLQPEEEWPGAKLRPVFKEEQDNKSDLDTNPAIRLQNLRVSDDSQEPKKVIDSDDDSSYLSSDDDLQPLDLSETIDEIPMVGDRPATLQDMLTGLRKTNEPKTVVLALKQLPVLVESQPDELNTMSQSLAKAIISAPVPDWSDDEEETSLIAPYLLEEQGSKQGLEKYRFASMVSLLIASPLQGGQALISEVYSSSLTVVDRLGIMDALSRAGQHLSAGGSSILTHGLSSNTNNGNDKTRVLKDASSEPAGKSRIWGVRALKKMQSGPQRVFRNLFVDVALVWTSALLTECDRVKHGVDLFGKQHAVLGKLLVTLGSFAQSVSQTSVSAQLALAILELVASPSIHQHPQPYVRRSALSAVFQVLCGLPPARIAYASLGGWKESNTDSMLSERLEWLMDFTSNAATSDIDETCRLIASGCAEKQAGIASEAMQIMANSTGGLWPDVANDVNFRAPFRLK